MPLHTDHRLLLALKCTQMPALAYFTGDY